jgi:hypothetical protein
MPSGYTTTAAPGLAHVKAIAGLHAVVGFLAVGQEGFEALQLQLFLDGFGQVVADF